MSKIEKKCVSCFQVLSDATRVRILKGLQERKANVASITEALDVTQPTVSHHLKLLDSFGFLQKERRGRETYYSFNKNFPCKGCGVFTSPIKL
ncbi:MAG: winged helix-turn-helix transcriptional regulator [Candidatus Ryanbacteria bacterium]|nr:winged helix-turn-helix transcriptional regulator [Candidatus Ryanbacteria bacterium]